MIVAANKEYFAATWRYMGTTNYTAAERLQLTAEKKASARQRRKDKKMKVSGKAVFGLKKIISTKK